MTRATPGRGKKKTTTVIEEPIDPELMEGGPSELDVSLESVEDTEALSSVLESFGETSVLLKVYRDTPTGQEFCYPCQSLDETFIQKNYGGGTYAVRIFIADKYRKTIKVKIAQPVAGGPSSANEGSSHSAFLEKLLMALLMKETPVHANVPTVTDLVNSLGTLDSLRGKQESGMEMFIKGMEMAQGFEGGGATDWKSKLFGMAEKVLPAITPALTSFMGSRNPPPGNPPVTAGGAPTPDEERAMVTAMLKQGIDFLKPQFLGGLDPESAVNFVVSNVQTNPQYQLLVRAICSMEFSEFAAIDPTIGTEPLFTPFRTFYDGLRSEFIPADPVDDDTGGSVGDAGDTGDHGNPRPNGGKFPRGA